MVVWDLDGWGECDLMGFVVYVLRHCRDADV